MARLKFMIAGVSGSGKSTSLMNLTPQEGVLYLNMEATKPLPFPNKFKKPTKALKATQVFNAFTQAEADPTIHTIVIDTVSFMMDMFESQEVLTSTNTQHGWQLYQQFYKELQQTYIANSTKNVILLAHNVEELTPQGELKTYVKVKGALAVQGLEAYESIVVYTMKKTIDELEAFGYDPNLLHITEEDKENGFKHVFQTRVTKDMVNSRLRTPLNLFTRQQTYIDNDVAMLLTYLENYYGIGSNRT